VKPTRHFELFACETIRDADTGNVLQFDHSFIVSEQVDGKDRPTNAQLSFDEWLEREMLWNYHLERGDGYADEEAVYAQDERDW